VISKPVVREGLLGKPRETKIVDFLERLFNTLEWNSEVGSRAFYQISSLKK